LFPQAVEAPRITNSAVKAAATTRPLIGRPLARNVALDEPIARSIRELERAMRLVDVAMTVPPHGRG
jgi:hypothetical protein